MTTPGAEERGPGKRWMMRAGVGTGQRVGDRHWLSLAGSNGEVVVVDLKTTTNDDEGR